MISGAREEVGHPVRVERARKFKTWSEMEWSALRLPNLLGEEDDGMIDMRQTDVSSLHEEPSSTHSHARHSSLMDLDRKLLFQDQENHGHGEGSIKSPVPRQDRFTDLQHGSTSLTAFMSSTQPMSDLPDLIVKDIPITQRPKNRRSVTFAGDLSTMPRSEVPALSTEDLMDTNASGHFEFYQNVSSLAESCDSSSKEARFSDFMTGPVSISSADQPSSASSICSSSSTASSAATSPSDQVPQFPQQNQGGIELQRKRQLRRGAHSRALSEPKLSVVDIEHSASVGEESTIWAAPKGPSEDAKRQDSLDMTQKQRTEHPAAHSQTSFSQRDQTGTGRSNTSTTTAAPRQEETRGTAHLAPDSSNNLPGGGYPAMYANQPPMLADPLQYVYPGTFHTPPLVNQPVILGGMPLPPPPPLTLPYTSPEAAQQMQEAHNVMMMQWMQMHQQMLMMSPEQQHQLPFPSPYMRPPQHGGGYGSGYYSSRRRSTGAHGNRSRKLVSIILQDCKASRRAPSIEDVAGHVVEFATDSHGSRVVQELMENGTDDVKHVLVTEALVDGVNLMCDTFGNYVAQNFLVHATQSQREAILDLMRGAVVHLSKNSHGCRVVQKAFELAPDSIWFDLVSELCASTQVMLECARDGHATHCLQKAVSMLMHFGRKRCPGNDRLLESIRAAVSSDAVALGSHPNASRLVLLVMGDCGTRTQSQALEDILAALQRAFSTLMLDQHGNFCLQHILENGRPEQIRAVRQVIQKNILKLSCHKFGSHLVEKCLSQAPDAVVSDIVSTILESSDKFTQAAKDGDSDGSMLLVFMKDPYANFVVQRAYDVCKGNLRKKLAHEVTARAKLVSKYTYGRHILHHVSKN